jgi:single-strand DNA-binding protein
MAGINRAQILGRLGQDPDVRFTQSGEAMTTLSIATSLSWKDKQTGEAKEKTEWHHCVCFGRTAEIARDYLAKAGKSMSKAAFRRANGKAKMARTAIPPKSFAKICNCWGHAPTPPPPPPHPRPPTAPKPPRHPRQRQISTMTSPF